MGCVPSAARDADDAAGDARLPLPAPDVTRTPSEAAASDMSRRVSTAVQPVLLSTRAVTKKDVLDQRTRAASLTSSLSLTSPAAAVPPHGSRVALQPAAREPLSRRMSRIGTLNRHQLIEGIDAASKSKDGPAGANSDLGRRLSSLGLSSVEMEGDGNCQFRALADQLFGHQKHHAVTRQAAVEHMRRNGDFFGMYFEGEHEFHAYLRDMGRSRTWGDELTLRAAVEAFGCNAHGPSPGARIPETTARSAPRLGASHTPGLRVGAVVTSEPANWYLVYQPEGEPLSSMPLPRGASPPRRGKEAFISYISPIHYNAIQAR